MSQLLGEPARRVMGTEGRLSILASPSVVTFLLVIESDGYRSPEDNTQFAKKVRFAPEEFVVKP